MSRTPKQQKSSPSAAVVKHSRKEEGGGRSHSGKRGPRDSDPQRPKGRALVKEEGPEPRNAGSRRKPGETGCALL